MGIFSKKKKNGKAMKEDEKQNKTKQKFSHFEVASILRYGKEISYLVPQNSLKIRTEYDPGFSLHSANTNTILSVFPMYFLLKV